jgi:hypothetical protein
MLLKLIVGNLTAQEMRLLQVIAIEPAAQKARLLPRHPK